MIVERGRCVLADQIPPGRRGRSTAPPRAGSELGVGPAFMTVGPILKVLVANLC